MMFFLDNKHITPDVRRAIEHAMNGMRAADQVAISMRIDGVVHVVGANWLAGLQLAKHEHAVQNRINEQQKKDNPND